MSARRVIGVIGGSGLYELSGLTNVHEQRVTTPFGDPSDALLVGDLDEVQLVFVPRHGRGHRLTPSEVPYAANIHAYSNKRTVAIAFSFFYIALNVGGVLSGQLIDRTKERRSSFFGDGVVGHIAFAEPFCHELRNLLLGAVQGCGTTVHPHGTLVVMEGPAFSTRAESHLYRSWGAHIIGMTALPEAKLAREAELCYAALALSTDYDCWREEEAAVTVDAVVAVLRRSGCNTSSVATSHRLRSKMGFLRRNVSAFD